MTTTDRTPRKLIVGTNLKLHQTPQETARFVADIAERTTAVRDRADVQRFVIPPFTSLPTAVEHAAGSGIWIGAQNVFWAPDGPYTGEISVGMLRAVGADLVLIGHAERRTLFGETDEVVNKKVLTAAEAGFQILLCVGETAAEKGYGVGPESVVRQLKIGLYNLPPARIGQIMIGYEPVWSIGVGGTAAQPEDVAAIAGDIRVALGDRFGSAGGSIPILYGGSVSPNNCGGFVTLPTIDGLFVGRAGWTVDGYAAILEAAIAARA